VRQFDDRHLVETQLARGSQAPVARDDAVVAIHQQRIGPAVLDDAGGDLGDLRIGVRARIAGVGDQRLDLAVLDVERVQNRFLKKLRPAQGRSGLWSGRAERCSVATKKPADDQTVAGS